MNLKLSTPDLPLSIPFAKSRNKVIEGGRMMNLKLSTPDLPSSIPFAKSKNKEKIEDAD